ncbi:PhnA-like protein [Ensifer soli]|uniref:PhnA-like protein n=1 Tax=Ciceribacter sp. sgz301302 TaxID=3342379 RepID=UPI0035B8D8B0
MAVSSTITPVLNPDVAVARYAGVSSVSWGAILAGVAVALTTQLLLNLLGAGVGAAVIDPVSGDTPTATTFSLSTAAWFIVSGLVASFIGGYVASRLSGRPARAVGGLHGISSWAVTTLVVFYLLTTSIGAIVGGAFSGLGSVISSAGSAVATTATAASPALAAATDPLATIEQNVRQASGGNDPAALRDTAVQAVRAALTGNEAEAEAARNRAADAIARAQSIPVDQARQQVAAYEQQYKDAVAAAKEQAVAAADMTASAVSAGAFVAFIALVIGAIAAWFGGVWGSRAAAAKPIA